MAIPASFIVDVQPRVIRGGSNDLEMNGLILSDNDRISATSMVLAFGSAAAVGSYFGLDSQEYAAAQVYFTGYVNKSSAPRAFYVARRVKEAVPGWLRSASYSGTLAALKAVSNGSLSLTIDGAVVTASNVSFASAASLSDVATALQTALASQATGVKVSYSSLDGAFTITSGTKGASSIVEPAPSTGTGTDLASLLGLTLAAGAVVSAGSATLNVAQQMDAILATTENWVTFTTLEEADSTEMLEWAAWANANYGWLYVPWTTQAATADQNATTDPASVLKAAGYDHVALVYGTLAYAMFVMGAIGSISWLRPNGTVTLAFKRQDGLAPYVTTEEAAQALEDKNCNYFGNFATRNAEFAFLYNGCLTSSDYGFIDPYINSVWLNNRLQVALMDGLSLTGRVPYNERGYALIRAWLMAPVKAALTNGAIEPGVQLSDAQKSALFNEAGQDIAGELETQGYCIQIQDPDATVRVRRESPVINFWYTYGGAVQRIEVASSAIV